MPLSFSDLTPFTLDVKGKKINAALCTLKRFLFNTHYEPNLYTKASVHHIKLMCDNQHFLQN